MSTILPGVLRHQTCMYMFVQKLSETPIFRYILDLGFDGCTIPVRDVYYWRTQIQASNFMSFPKRTLKSEKFHVDLGVKICWPPFLCRIRVNNRPKIKFLSRKLDSGFGGIFSITNLALLARAKI